MLEDARCVGCRITAPKTNTEQTLLTTMGWRVTRRRTANGEMYTELRCPTCWAQYKARSIPPKPLR
jgi:hypothetical protein